MTILVLPNTRTCLQGHHFTKVHVEASIMLVRACVGCIPQTHLFIFGSLIA